MERKLELITLTGCEVMEKTLENIFTMAATIYNQVVTFADDVNDDNFDFQILYTDKGVLQSARLLTSLSRIKASHKDVVMTIEEFDKIITNAEELRKDTLFGRFGIFNERVYRKNKELYEFMKNAEVEIRIMIENITKATNKLENYLGELEEKGEKIIVGKD